MHTGGVLGANSGGLVASAGAIALSDDGKSKKKGRKRDDREEFIILFVVSVLSIGIGVIAITSPETFWFGVLLIISGLFGIIYGIIDCNRNKRR